MRSENLDKNASTQDSSNNEAEQQRILARMAMIHARVEKTSFFNKLTPEQMDELILTSELECFDADEQIVKEGDPSNDIYIILDGSVRVSVENEGNKETYICTLGEGDVFGEAGMFIETPRTASIYSTDSVNVLKISRDSFFEFIRNHPGKGVLILSRIIFSLLSKLREANQELAYERKSDYDQTAVDNLVERLIKK